MMNSDQLGVLLALLMCSDPWPLLEVERKIIEEFADEEAKRHGYSDWIEAYHSL